ncbi:MAG: nucleotidyl transferase AbiEii/AbiGii toxin family protein [Cyanobacteria bacterium HKST-UBA02]|nr:nucleotidyl transferase AbiEii/AbiGii toxin family protein [Cyanobacteria bacterium HKST-UBA02]
MSEFLHRRADFSDLLRIVTEQTGITPTLVEKDYWIMHCLWALKKQEFTFELKGGTSLSKGFGIIKRFSEDIDIRFEPPAAMDVKTGKNHDKDIHIESRRKFYDWLTAEINVPDITASRATEYDDERLRNGGIRLTYETKTEELQGVKPGILLEVGFDDTTPNTPVDISSWAMESARTSNVDVIDGRALGILCYNPEFTFVEKLQTISTKFRKFRETGKIPPNFFRHYYDVYCLLEVDEVKEFIGTDKYEERKRQRFPKADELRIAANPAFLFENSEELERFKKEYQGTEALYYAGQPSLAEIASKIKEHIERL